MDLADLGWTARHDAEFEPYASRGLEPGRIALEHNHVYRVLTRSGERLAEAAGRLKHRATGRRDLPTVGDWVALPRDHHGRRAQIGAVLPRRSAFSRKAAGRETDEQVIAANIDTVFVVFALGGALKARGIERYLVVARQSGAQPVVVLNKSDLSPDVAADTAEAISVAGDAHLHVVSAREDPELAALEQYLSRGRTVALLGPSGAGKSSIVNRLIGRELLPTGDVRDWDARGRHTSVHRQLVVREGGGIVIDTPGMRELQLWAVEDEVGETFADIAALGESCRFRDCRHGQEPGCAVKAAVEAGSLPAGRYESYVKLQAEQAAFGRLHDERARSEERRQTKIAQRTYRAQKSERRRDR